MHIFLSVSVCEYTIMTCNLQHAYSPGMQMTTIFVFISHKKSSKNPPKKALFFGSQNLAAILRVKRIPPLNIGQRGFFQSMYNIKKWLEFSRAKLDRQSLICVIFLCFFSISPVVRRCFFLGFWSFFPLEVVFLRCFDLRRFVSQIAFLGHQPFTCGQLHRDTAVARRHFNGIRR